MKKLVAMMLAALMILGLAACGEQPEQTTNSPTASTAGTESSTTTPAASESENKKLLIGVNMGSIDQSYYNYLRMGLEEELNADTTELYVTYHEWSVDTQIRQVEDFITMGCDLIVVVCADPEGVLPALTAAKEAGVPVIEMDCKSNYPEYSIAQFISDDYDCGYQCGKAIAEAMGGEGVVQSYVITNTINSQLRLKGFSEAIAEYPGIDNVYNATEKFDAVTAQTVLENMLIAHPETKGLFCSNDKIASAAVNFFKANNMTGVYLGHAAGGTRETVYTWLQEGWDYCAYDQNPVKMGAAVMKAIYDYFENGTTYSENTYIPGELRFKGDEYICDPVYYKD